MALLYASYLYDGVAYTADRLKSEARHLLLSCGGHGRLNDDFDAPYAIELALAHSLDDDDQGWHDYLGVYLLENREVNGKPAWRHADNPILWLAFDGVGWACQPQDRLGDRFGWLQLRDPAAPHLSRHMWQVAPDDASRWITQPDLSCRSVPFPSRRPGQGVLPRDARAAVDDEAPVPRLRDTVEGASPGAPVPPPSLPPPKGEYVARAKGMNTSALL